jgi:NADPH2:quinone reductase
MSKEIVKAIRITETGAPEVMKWVDVELGEPGPGEVLIRHHACGHCPAELAWKAPA